MASYQVPLENLGPALSAYLGRFMVAAYVALRAEVVTQAYLGLEEISPVGDPAKDPHPGKYRASHITSVGSPQTVVLPDMPSYPLGGAPAVEAVLADADPSASLFIANAAASASRPNDPYAALLEPGRRQYTRVRGHKTMWIGSTQAPEGIYGPTVRDLRERGAEITAAAVAHLRERMTA